MLRQRLSDDTTALKSSLPMSAQSSAAIFPGGPFSEIFTEGRMAVKLCSLMIDTAWDLLYAFSAYNNEGV